MSDEFEAVWATTRPAFAQEQTFQRARRLALGSLACLGRHTVTGLITTTGNQSVDWSADYRLFERSRFDRERLFAALRGCVLPHVNRQAPFVAMMDDTQMR